MEADVIPNRLQILLPRSRAAKPSRRAFLMPVAEQRIKEHDEEPGQPGPSD
jgi:hypothetical protein